MTCCLFCLRKGGATNHSHNCCGGQAASGNNHHPGALGRQGRIGGGGPYSSLRIFGLDATLGGGGGCPMGLAAPGLES